jgi:hypothetical protein
LREFRTAYKNRALMPGEKREKEREKDKELVGSHSRAAGSFVGIR